MHCLIVFIDNDFILSVNIKVLSDIDIRKLFKKTTLVWQNFKIKSFFI